MTKANWLIGGALAIAFTAGTALFRPESEKEGRLTRLTKIQVEGVPDKIVQVELVNTGGGVHKYDTRALALDPQDFHTGKNYAVVTRNSPLQSLWSAVSGYASPAQFFGKTTNDMLADSFRHTAEAQSEAYMRFHGCAP